MKGLKQESHQRLALLKKNLILRGASMESLQVLAECSRPARLRKGAILWQQGDPASSVACVAQGRLLVQKSDAHGHLAYYFERKAGDLIGHASLAAGLPSRSAAQTPPSHHTTIIAREETVVIQIASSIFQGIMNREPLLVRLLISDLCEYMRVLMEEIFIERVHTGKMLLASKLLGLAAMENPVADSTYLRYSQAELSLFTGLRPRNINKFLRELPAVTTLSGRKGVHIESIATLKAFVLSTGGD
jgi:CRP/FNR family transcriptional regulator, cyclic AMP receptor protein